MLGFGLIESVLESHEPCSIFLNSRSPESGWKRLSYEERRKCKSLTTVCWG